MRWLRGIRRRDIELVQSTEPHGGIGEPGTSVTIAAFVNYPATGKRLYTLPAIADDLAEGKAA